MTHASQLVDAFAGSNRFDSYQALVAMGADALPALRQGLQSANWKTRQWSAICLDHVADEDALIDLIPLLQDPSPKVRLWAVHSLGCDHCKDDVTCPVDIVPLLIERARNDESIRVRRMAVIMLGKEFQDERAGPLFEEILRDEEDRKLLLHAGEGLKRLRGA